MKVRCDREDDALVMHLGEGAVDYAEEVDGFIVHFTADHRPVLIELLGASDLLARLGKITATATSGVDVTL